MKLGRPERNNVGPKYYGPWRINLGAPWEMGPCAVARAALPMGPGLLPTEHFYFREGEVGGKC